MYRLSVRRCELICKKLQEKAGIDKRVHPHAFRHARATERANYLTEAQMNVRFGWTPGSGMSRIYVHLSGKDLDQTELRLAGLLKEDDIPKRALTPEHCPRCRTPCAQDALYCYKCSAALTEDVANRQDMMHNSTLAHPQIQVELQEENQQN